MNVLDSVVCGLWWVPAKLSHMHMFCLILDKKIINPSSLLLLI